LTPQETFYQRILANDPEEATEQAEEFGKGRLLTEFFDEVAIPALVRAQADSDRGVLSSDTRAAFKGTIGSMLENLSHDEDTSPMAERGTVAKAEHRSRIVCVAGRNELDEAAALLLVNLLRSERHLEVGPPLSPDALSVDAVFLPLFKDASVICLSLVSTSSLARARYLVRRLRRRAPSARVVVGFWGAPAREFPVEETTRSISAQALAFSMSDALVAMDAMLRAESGPARVSFPL
jgi:hypothetical protein